MGGQVGLLIMHTIRQLAVAAMVLLVFGCSDQQPNSNASRAIADVNARENRFPTYPQPNTTYLSFSLAHGFQVNYLAPRGAAWLWYPGNKRGVPEEYKRDVVAGRNVICWRHPSNSYNPVTKTKGGPFACENLAFSQRTIIAALPGDPFALKTGQVPYPLKRCTAPAQFRFDRTVFSC